jgi:hypothetical protein
MRARTRFSISISSPSISSKQGSAPSKDQLIQLRARISSEQGSADSAPSKDQLRANSLPSFRASSRAYTPSKVRPSAYIPPRLVGAYTSVIPREDAVVCVYVLVMLVWWCCCVWMLECRVMLWVNVCMCTCVCVRVV